MTIGTLIGIVIIGGVLYLMMKKGGGCCGGHDHGDHGQDAHADHTLSETEHHHEEHGELTADEKDPVCGMTVDKTALVTTHKGKSYRFCSESCKTTFDSNPQKFV